MRWSVRIILAASLVIFSRALPAQVSVTPAAAVQQLAPQLVSFAGSQQNFANLVNGLAQGTTVQLVSVLPDGSAQLVSFAPGAPLAPVEIARTLESARQQLISLGISSPTAEQIGAALQGGPSLNVQLFPGPVALNPALAPARINTSDSRLPSGATSRSPVAGNLSNSPLPGSSTPAPNTPGATPSTGAATAPRGTVTSRQAK